MQSQRCPKSLNRELTDLPRGYCLVPRSTAEVGTPAVQMDAVLDLRQRWHRLARVLRVELLRREDLVEHILCDFGIELRLDLLARNLAADVIASLLREKRCLPPLIPQALPLENCHVGFHRLLAARFRSGFALELLAAARALDVQLLVLLLQMVKLSLELEVAMLLHLVRQHPAVNLVHMLQCLLSFFFGLPV